MEAPNARQFRPFVMNISYHESTRRLKLSVAEVETLDAAKIPIRQQYHRNEPVGAGRGKRYNGGRGQRKRRQ
jgi:hypothetical protein